MKKTILISILVFAVVLTILIMIFVVPRIYTIFTQEDKRPSATFFGYPLKFSEGNSITVKEAYIEEDILTVKVQADFSTMKLEDIYEIAISSSFIHSSIVIDKELTNRKNGRDVFDKQGLSEEIYLMFKAEEFKETADMVNYTLVFVQVNKQNGTSHSYRMCLDDPEATEETSHVVEYQSENDCTYAYMDDKTFVYDKYAFKYKLWVTAKNAEGNPVGAYVVLSNKPEVTASEVEKALASSMAVPMSEAEFIVTGLYSARVECDVDSKGRFVYNGKTYKDIVEFTETDNETSKKTLYSVLTNDANINYMEIINSSNTDQFIVIDKQEVE